MVETKTKKKNGANWPRLLRRGLWVGLAIAIVGLIVVASLPKPVPVDAVSATRQSLRVTVDEDGRTRVMDRYVIDAPLIGNLDRIELDPGDEVEEGAVIARIVPLARPLMDAQGRAETEARVSASSAQRRQATATVQRASAALGFAESTVERQRRLVSQGSVAPEVLERAELELRTRREELASAEFGVRVATHQLQMARAALGADSSETAEQFELTTPLAATILRVLRESAGVVQPGMHLVEVGDPSRLEIVTDVLTSDAVQIERGAPVLIERWGGEAELRGHVRRIDPSAFTMTSALGVQEQRVNVVIDLDSERDDWQRLGDGYRVETRIVIWESEDVVTVPSSAIFRSGESWSLFEIRDGKAVQTEVTIGRQNGVVVQILDGIEEGAQVVVHPSDRVVDGVAVEVR